MYHIESQPYNPTNEEIIYLLFRLSVITDGMSELTQQFLADGIKRMAHTNIMQMHFDKGLKDLEYSIPMQVGAVGLSNRELTKIAREIMKFRFNGNKKIVKGNVFIKDNAVYITYSRDYLNAIFELER